MEREEMKKQVFNPFLPLNEYVPDGEPHVSGDRVYLFGSHDKEGGETFECVLQLKSGIYPLYFQYTGEGTMEFLEFTLQEVERI